MRARVYVDGFNVYYRGLRKTRYKWLDLKLLASNLLGPDDDIDLVRYFTAAVSPKSGDPAAQTRQETYLRALRSGGDVSIHMGRFLSKRIVRPLVSDPETYVEVHDTEEKGSDVNLATYLLKDAYEDKFDVALVMSQDTDLIEPLRIVRHELDKVLGVAWFDRSQPGKRHKRNASFIRHVSNTMLRESQFPDPVIGKGGRRIPKPEEWA